jgi:hypothetical protein
VDFDWENLKMNRKILFATMVGIAIETLAILSFIGIAKTTFAVLGEQILAAVSLAALVIFLIVLSRSFSIKLLFLLAAFFAVGAASVLQILGHTFFPGLVKDMDLLSWENLQIAVILTLLVFCCYVLGILMIVALRNMINWYSGLTAK